MVAVLVMSTECIRVGETTDAGDGRDGGKDRAG